MYTEIIKQSFYGPIDRLVIMESFESEMPDSPNCAFGDVLDQVGKEILLDGYTYRIETVMEDIASGKIYGLLKELQMPENEDVS